MFNLGNILNKFFMNLVNLFNVMFLKILLYFLVELYEDLVKIDVIFFFWIIEIKNFFNLFVNFELFLLFFN